MARSRFPFSTGPVISIGVPIAYMMLLFLARLVFWFTAWRIRIESFGVDAGKLCACDRERVYMQLILRSIGTA
jgi:hypothetical protein